MFEYEGSDLDTRGPCSYDFVALKSSSVQVYDDIIRGFHIPFSPVEI